MEKQQLVSTITQSGSMSATEAFLEHGRSEEEEGKKMTRELNHCEDQGLRRSSDELGIFHHDRYNLVLVASFLLGVGTLLPWNVFITAKNYWDYKFRDPANETVTTDLQVNFSPYLIVTFNLPYIICMTLTTLYSHRIRHIVANSVCLCLILLTFVTVTALVPLNSDSWQYGFLAVTLCQVVAISINNGVVQTGVMGLLSLLPPRYIYIALNGQAIAGIFTSVLNVVILLVGHGALESALIYFVSAVVALIIAGISYGALHSSSYFKYYYHMSHSPENKSVDSNGDQAVPTPSMRVLFKLIWKYCLAMVAIFWVTIAAFPAICSEVVSTSAPEGSIWATLFVPLVCFVIFNVGDFVGRFISSWLPVPQGRPNLVLALTAARIIFIPLFMLCHLRKHVYLPSFFNHDGFYIAFMNLFALSNGYLVTTIFMLGPKAVHLEYQQKAGSLLVTCLGIGITLGALTSLFLVQIL